MDTSYSLDVGLPVWITLPDAEATSTVSVQQWRRAVIVAPLADNRWVVRMDETHLSRQKYEIDAQHIHVRSESEQELLAPNLCHLTEVSPPEVVNALQLRCERGLSHVYAGPLLVHVNPSSLKIAEITQDYSAEKHREYRTSSIDLVHQKRPAHVYGFAAAAFSRMMHMGDSQLIILVGPAGSGKTTQTMHVLDHLTYLSVEQLGRNISSTTEDNFSIESKLFNSVASSSTTHRKTIATHPSPASSSKHSIRSDPPAAADRIGSILTLKQQLDAAITVLRLMGNVGVEDPLYGNDASRMTMNIDLQFDKDYGLCGASLTAFLLDVSIIQGASGRPHKRTFHSLHAARFSSKTIRGVTASPSVRSAGTMHRSKLAPTATTTSAFAYLWLPGDEPTSTTAHTDSDTRDEYNWELLLQCLTQLSISAYEQTFVAQALAAVLQLGNLIFIQPDPSYPPTPADPILFKHICSLLSVDEKILISLLYNDINTKESTTSSSASNYFNTQSSSSSTGSSGAASMTIEQLYGRRDALAQLVYTMVFEWMTSQINSLLSFSNVNNNNMYCISIIDSPGHVSDHTGGAALCNIVAESLHDRAIRDVIIANAQNLRRNHIPLPSLQIVDRSSSASLLLSLLYFLSEVPNCSESTLLTCLETLKTNYKESGTSTIKIDTDNDVLLLYDKESITVRHTGGVVTYSITELRHLACHTTSDAFITALRQTDNLVIRHVVTSKYTTLVEREALYLQNLRKIQITNSIKKSNRNMNSSYDSTTVTDAATFGAWSTSPSLCYSLCQSPIDDTISYGVRALDYFKSNLRHVLVPTFDRYVSVVVCLVAKPTAFTRSWSPPKGPRSALDSSLAPRYIVSEHTLLCQLSDSVVLPTLQWTRLGYADAIPHTTFRQSYRCLVRHSEECRHMNDEDACRWIASHILNHTVYQVGTQDVLLKRGKTAELISTVSRTRLTAAILLQSWWRGLLTRRMFLKLSALKHRAAVMVQATFKVVIARKKFIKKHAHVTRSVTIVSRAYRHYRRRCLREYVYDCARRIQCCYRSCIARYEAKRRRWAIGVFQREWRSSRTRRWFSVYKKHYLRASITIQRWVRGWLERIHWRRRARLIKSALLIQETYLKHLNRRHAAAYVIQKAYRAKLAESALQWMMKQMQKTVFIAQWAYTDLKAKKMAEEQGKWTQSAAVIQRAWRVTRPLLRAKKEREERRASTFIRLEHAFETEDYDEIEKIVFLAKEEKFDDILASVCSRLSDMERLFARRVAEDKANAVVALQMALLDGGIGSIRASVTEVRRLGIEDPEVDELLVKAERELFYEAQRRSEERRRLQARLERAVSGEDSAAFLAAMAETRRLGYEDVAQEGRLQWHAMLEKRQKYLEETAAFIIQDWWRNLNGLESPDPSIDLYEEHIAKTGQKRPPTLPGTTFAGKLSRPGYASLLVKRIRVDTLRDDPRLAMESQRLLSEHIAKKFLNRFWQSHMQRQKSVEAAESKRLAELELLDPDAIQKNIAASKIQRKWKMHQERIEEVEKEVYCCIMIQRWWRRNLACRAKQVREWVQQWALQQMDAAAVTIQRIVRGYQCRRRLLKQLHQEIHATEKQNHDAILAKYLDERRTSPSPLTKQLSHMSDDDYQKQDEPRVRESNGVTSTHPITHPSRPRKVLTESDDLVTIMLSQRTCNRKDLHTAPTVLKPNPINHTTLHLTGVTGIEMNQLKKIRCNGQQLQKIASERSHREMSSVLDSSVARLHKDSGLTMEERANARAKRVWEREMARQQEDNNRRHGINGSHRHQHDLVSNMHEVYEERHQRQSPTVAQQPLSPSLSHHQSSMKSTHSPRAGSPRRGPPTPSTNGHASSSPRSIGRTTTKKGMMAGGDISVATEDDRLARALTRMMALINTAPLGSGMYGSEESNKYLHLICDKLCDEAHAAMDVDRAPMYDRILGVLMQRKLNEKLNNRYNINESMIEEQQRDIEKEQFKRDHLSVTPTSTNVPSLKLTSLPSPSPTNSSNLRQASSSGAPTLETSSSFLGDRTRGISSLRQWEKEKSNERAVLALSASNRDRERQHKGSASSPQRSRPVSRDQGVSSSNTRSLSPRQSQSQQQRSSSPRPSSPRMSRNPPSSTSTSTTPHSPSYMKPSQSSPVSEERETIDKSGSFIARSVPVSVRRPVTVKEEEGRQLADLKHFAKQSAYDLNSPVPTPVIRDPPASSFDRKKTVDVVGKVDRIIHSKQSKKIGKDDVNDMMRRIQEAQQRRENALLLARAEAMIAAASTCRPVPNINEKSRKLASNTRPIQERVMDEVERRDRKLAATRHAIEEMEASRGGYGSVHKKVVSESDHQRIVEDLVEWERKKQQRLTQKRRDMREAEEKDVLASLMSSPLPSPGTSRLSNHLIGRNDKDRLYLQGRHSQMQGETSKPLGSGSAYFTESRGPVVGLHPIAP